MPTSETRPSRLESLGVEGLGPGGEGTAGEDRTARIFRGSHETLGDSATNQRRRVLLDLADSEISR